MELDASVTLNFTYKKAPFELSHFDFSYVQLDFLTKLFLPLHHVIFLLLSPIIISDFENDIVSPELSSTLYYHRPKLFLPLYRRHLPPSLSHYHINFNSDIISLALSPTPGFTSHSVCSIFGNTHSIVCLFTNKLPDNPSTLYVL
ncbi:hypothetical protein AB6A40_009468 [Gnathostoma spinigerum]|uniref:Uncharacterized protein n=1 Tax=Gnathostoma spinigerum TaxID=75299 RepID=A0ABD6EZK4_9BILA